MTNTIFVINRNDLAKKVAEENGISQAKALKVVTVLFREMEEQLSAGNAVNISGFGKFEVHERAGRMGVNPATGERIEIAPVKSPVFKAGKVLKDAVR